MPVAINSQQRQGAMLPEIVDAISRGVEAVNSVAANKLNMAKLDAMKRESAINAEADKPDSPLSQLARQEQGLYYSAAQKGGYAGGGDIQKMQGLLGGSPAQGEEGQPGYVAAVPALSATQIKTALPEGGALTKFISGEQAAKAAQIRMQGIVGVKQAQLEETRGQHSVDAGAAFEKDPIIRMSKTNLNSLTKSQSILENPNKPVTSKDLNLAYNDYINSVAVGGAATEGKIHRELPETFATEFNDLKSRFGEFDDLRQDPTGAQLIKLLKENIATVRNDIASAVSDQAGNIYQNFAEHPNQRVRDIAAKKLKTYAPDKYAEIFGGAPSRPSFSSNLGQSGEQPPAASDMVDVISPEGKAGKIPRVKLETAQQRGFKVK